MVAGRRSRDPSAHVAQQRAKPAPGSAHAVVTVSDAGDPAEREADALAARVMSNAGPPGVPARTADPSVVYRQQVKSVDPRCGKTQALSAEDLNAEGKLAHLYIQTDYAKNPGGDTWPESTDNVAALSLVTATRSPVLEWDSSLKTKPTRNSAPFTADRHHLQRRYCLSAYCCWSSSKRNARSD